MKPEASLSQRVTKGGLWVFALRMLENVLRLMKLVIVARLLAPHDFGLFGIALLAMSALETFSQTGFQTALVQKKGDIAPYLNNAWTVSIIRGIFLFIILFLGAPYIALFFSNPKASPIIQVIGASLLVGGFTNSGIVYLQKELKFNKQFLYRLSTTIADFVVVLAAALILRNVWALVFGMLAGSFAGVAASYMIHPYRPHFTLDIEKSRELFGFGKWVFGSAVLVFLITQGDDAFVGKFLGVTMLGFYQMAYRISNMPATEITHVISQVTFPAYSKIQDDLPRLREAYLRVLQFTAFLSFPISGLIFVLAPDFTKLFLGEKWLPIVPAMQVLCLFGLVRSFGATTGPLFHGVGAPKILTNLAMFQLLLLAAIIYPLTVQWGLIGTSIAVLSPNIITQLIAARKVIHIIKARVLNFTMLLIIPIIGTSIMIIAILLLKHFSKAYLLSFLIYIFTGPVIYLGFIYLFDIILTTNYKKGILALIKSL